MFKTLAYNQDEKQEIWGWAQSSFISYFCKTNRFPPLSDF